MVEFPPILIKASAGTGKTSQLAARYIALLASGELPEKILATTFTRKAAAEIWERVLITLAKSSLSDEFLEQTNKRFRLNLTKKLAHEALKRFVRNQHRTRICTLDSFYSQVARAFWMDLKLPADWEIIEEQEIYKRHEDTFSKLLDQIPFEETFELLTLINKKELNRQVFGKVTPILLKAYNMFLESDYSAWKWLNIEKGEENAIHELILSIESASCPKTATGSPHLGWVKALHTIASHLRKRDFKKTLETGMVKTALKGEFLFYKQPFPEELKIIVQNLINLIGPQILNQLSASLASLHDLLKHFDSILGNEISLNGKLSFSDLKDVIVREMVCSNLADLYFRLDSRISHLLFDEFQDTSRQDWYIIDPIADEILSKADGSSSFFCVGDEKQAIYGWRGGVSAIFDMLPKKYTQIEEHSVQKSYRCSKQILDFVNRIFSNISSNPLFSEKDRTPVEQWQSKFKHHESMSDKPGYVHVEVVGETDEPDNSTNKTIAVLKELTHSNPALSIGVLFRNNQSVETFIREARLAGIYVSEESGAPLIDSQTVAILVSLLRLCDHPGDGIAAFHVACSPLGLYLNFTDYQDKKKSAALSKQLRREIYSHGLGNFVQHIGTELLKFGTETDAIKMSQVIECAFQFETRSSGRIEDFADFLLKLKTESACQSNIRAMTIHNSKGLEFDVVFLPSLDSPLVKFSFDQLVCERNSPLGPPAKIGFCESDTIRALDRSGSLSRMVRQHCDDSLVEALCILYVAITRAKLGLFVYLDDSKSKSHTFASLIRLALSDIETTGVILEYGEKADVFRAVVETVVKPQCEAVITPRFFETKKRTRGLLKETPSHLEGGGLVSVSNVLYLKGVDSRLEGDVIHYLLSTIEWLDEVDISEEQLIQLLKRQRFDINIPSVISRFLRMIRNETVAKILNKNRYSDKFYEGLVVEREKKFSFLKNDRIVSGAFDRIVTGIDNSSTCFVEIIDFKTDSLQKRSLDDLIECYRPQLEIYRWAAKKFYKVDNQKLKTTIVFIDEGMEVNI